MTKQDEDNILGVPDQQTLKIARLEIEAVCAKHGLAYIVMLHTPGMVEQFYGFSPPYSVMTFNDRTGELRLRSKLHEDHGGDEKKQAYKQAATANMVDAFMFHLMRLAVMLRPITDFVNDALGATHTPSTYVPDPHEGRKQ